MDDHDYRRLRALTLEAILTTMRNAGADDNYDAMEVARREFPECPDMMLWEAYFELEEEAEAVFVGSMAEELGFLPSDPSEPLRQQPHSPASQEDDVNPTTVPVPTESGGSSHLEEDIPF